MLEDIIETLGIILDEKLLRDLSEAEQDIRKGRVKEIRRAHKRAREDSP